MSDFTGGDVNTVLRATRALSGDGNVQLSILTYALVHACRSLKVELTTLLDAVVDAYDDPREIVPLDSPQASVS